MLFWGLSPAVPTPSFTLLEGCSLLQKKGDLSQWCTSVTYSMVLRHWYTSCFSWTVEEDHSNLMWLNLTWMRYFSCNASKTDRLKQGEGRCIQPCCCPRYHPLWPLAFGLHFSPDHWHSLSGRHSCLEYSTEQTGWNWSCFNQTAMTTGSDDPLQLYGQKGSCISTFSPLFNR